MTLYDKLREWDIETLAEFITSLMEGVEDQLLESAQKYLSDGEYVSLLRMDHDMRVALNTQLLMQEDDGTTV